VLACALIFIFHFIRLLNGYGKDTDRNWPLGPCTVMSSHAASLLEGPREREKILVGLFCGRNKVRWQVVVDDEEE
jgi:hypothetical protein